MASRNHSASHPAPVPAPARQRHAPAPLSSTPSSTVPGGASAFAAARPAVILPACVAGAREQEQHGVCPRGSGRPQPKMGEAKVAAAVASPRSIVWWRCTRWNRIFKGSPDFRDLIDKAYTKLVSFNPLHAFVVLHIMQIYLINLCPVKCVFSVQIAL